MKHSDHRHGFSLIELLVVLTIISVLIAVLLPSISEARKQAQSSVCKSRERQMGVAFANYNVNNGGYFPYAAPYWTSDYPPFSTAQEQAWSFKISEYLGQYKLNDLPVQLRCPSNPWTYGLPSTTRVRTAATYGMSTAYPVTPTATRGTATTTKMLRENQLLVPSRVLLLGETPLATNASDVGRSSFSEGMTIPPTPFRTDNAQYSAYAPTGMWYTDEFAAPPAGTNPIVRVNHNIGWNSLMSDGSAKYSSKRELQTLAMQSVNLSANSEGLMFWSNRR